MVITSETLVQSHIYSGLGLESPNLEPIFMVMPPVIPPDLGVDLHVQSELNDLNTPTVPSCREAFMHLIPKYKDRSATASDLLAFKGRN